MKVANRVTGSTVDLRGATGASRVVSAGEGARRSTITLVHPRTPGMDEAILAALYNLVLFASVGPGMHINAVVYRVP